MPGFSLFGVKICILIHFIRNRLGIFPCPNFKKVNYEIHQQ